jgi:hypothetical protein
MSRELDTLVAERVMEWVYDRDYIIRADTLLYAVDRDIVRKWHPWSPSRSIVAAWDVFTEALLRFGTVSIYADMEDFGRGAFLGNGPEQVMTVTIGGYTVTAPVCEAICRAALSACGVEVPE